MRFRVRHIFNVRIIFTALLVVLLLKLLRSAKSLLRMDELNIFYLESFGSSRGQYLIDYIAANLAVKYTAGKNGKLFISLTNTGLQDIPASNWAIYFSHGGGFGSVASNKFKHIKESGVIIRHLDGWFYSIEPIITSNTSYFKTLRPNDTLVIDEVAHLKSKSYAFPNWYVSGHGYQARVIQSTVPGRLEMDGQFEMWSPQDRYNRHVVRDLRRHAKSIIPTPLVIKNENNKKIMLDKKWKIVYQKNLRKEAAIIADKLDLTAEESDSVINQAADRTISIALKDLSSHFTEFTKNQGIHVHEGYHISVKETNSVSVYGQSPAGVFYGVQSLVSLLDNSKKGEFSLPVGGILDAPRLEFRGLMLDVSRNFMTASEIMRTLDVMAMYKLNKLHLHLTDDQGWRIEIPSLPELTEIGSKRSHDLTEESSLLPYLGSGPEPDTMERQYYSVEEYQAILRHAESRYIEIIPEIDIPGHSHAAIQSMRMRYKRLKQSGADEATASKFLLNDLNDTSWYLGINEHTDNVLNPCIQSTYSFLNEVLKSIVNTHKAVQPLKTIHLGGDEVPEGALVASPACITLVKDYPKLRRNLKLFFMKHAIEIADQLGIIVQTWEDGVAHRGDQPVNVTDWPNKAGITINAWLKTAAPFVFADAGYKVVLTHAHKLYLDHPYEPDADELGLFWATRYIDSHTIFRYMFSRNLGNTSYSYRETCRIFGMKTENCVSLRRPENIIGMQVSLWGEMTRTADDIQFMLCPRLLAFAERAWHMAEWESAPSEKELSKLQEEDWTNFANTVGYKELERLERLKIKYRLPTPGIRMKGSTMQVNTEFPGSLIEYSTDGGQSWRRYSPDAELSYREVDDLRFSVVSHDLKRRGRVIRFSTK